jgi:hypothetical protein
MIPVEKLYSAHVQLGKKSIQLILNYFFSRCKINNDIDAESDNMKRIEKRIDRWDGC